jgi:hypothetical protein
MQKLDGKFHGMIARDRDGKIEPPDSFIVFVARDNALVPTLEFYLRECEKIGAGLEQLEAVARLICRVKDWRLANVEKCKTPDAEPGECH